jgi:hypothetical protein
MSASMTSTACGDVYSRVTAKIVADLEQGVRPVAAWYRTPRGRHWAHRRAIRLLQVAHHTGPSAATHVGTASNPAANLTIPRLPDARADKVIEQTRMPAVHGRHQLCPPVRRDHEDVATIAAL